MICRSRLGPWNTALPATFHLLYIVYSINCKMSIIPIQKFHLTLTDSQTIQETLNYGNTTVMNIFSKQRNFINRKAIFFFATQNKNETVALSAKDKISKGHNNNELSRTDNIANNASNVNNTGTKFSLDVDSDGNKLTQQQAEYFENSKVRDDDGNLLKVYHGTSKSFTAFSWCRLCQICTAYRKIFKTDMSKYLCKIMYNL